jgi:hypothetical protein
VEGFGRDELDVSGCLLGEETVDVGRDRGAWNATGSADADRPELAAGDEPLDETDRDRETPCDFGNREEKSVLGGGDHPAASRPVRVSRMAR